MEGGGLVVPETSSVGGSGGVLKVVKSQKMPLAGIAVRRKRLSDITNVASSGRPERSGTAAGENLQPTASAATKDYIADLLKENTALLRLLGERNKVIEMSNAELQKLRLALQKANQQNWQLAQANSQMLAELNSGKDRIRAMQHELGCKVALLRAKTVEMEEKKKLNKQPSEKISFEEGSTQCTESVANAARPTCPKNACYPSRKRTSRNQSLGSSTVMLQALVKEKDEGRRKSLRRRSGNLKSELCEPTEDLFEIEDVKFPICSLVTDPMHEDGSTQPNSSACSSSSTIMKPVKDEVQERSCSPQSQSQECCRSSVGRPLRKAAAKINSYKEIPLNVKMRRND